MILVIGSFMMDCVTKTSRIPEAKETLIGISYNNFLGGKGVNQAVAAKRLGSKVTMIGMVGNDDFGKQFLTLLEEEKIKSFVKKSDKSKTGIGSILVDSEGQNRIVVVPGANLDFQIKDLYELESEIMKADIIMAQLEMRMDVIEEIGKICKKNNKTFILNPAPANHLSDELLSSVTYLTPNETEIGLIVGKKTEEIAEITEAANELLKKGVKNVVVTLGDKGALLVNKEKNLLIEGYKVKAIDTVAAGDSFNGALANKLEQGCNLIDAIKFANKVGSYAVQKEGAIPSLPYLVDIII